MIIWRGILREQVGSRFCFANYLDLAIFSDNLVFKSKKYEKPHPMGWIAIKNILSLAGGFLTEADILMDNEFKNFIMKKAIDPRLIQKVRRILTCISEREVAYIGDSLTDLEFAENADINFIAVSWGRATEEEFRNSGARFIVDSYLQIIDLIEDLGVKVVIFDFDGTLVCHWPARYKAYCDKMAFINKKLEGKLELKVLGDIELREILKTYGFGRLSQATIAAILLAEGLITLDQLREISKRYYPSRTEIIARILEIANQKLESGDVDVNRSRAFKEYIFSTWSSIFKIAGEYYEPEIDDSWEEPSYFLVYRGVPMLLQELYPEHIICLYSSRTERGSRALLNSELKVQV
jgi:phosphoglycolate phosphatase-like HAD superfamily hydrolase